MEGLRRVANILNQVAGVGVDIRMERFQNTNLKSYGYLNLSGPFQFIIH
jgi:hypothetical protein